MRRRQRLAAQQALREQEKQQSRMQITRDSEGQVEQIYAGPIEEPRKYPETWLEVHEDRSVSVYLKHEDGTSTVEAVVNNGQITYPNKKEKSVAEVYGWGLPPKPLEEPAKEKPKRKPRKKLND